MRQFAYGQYSNGNVEIWGAGKAGWFSVRPSREYRAVYAEMVEAVELLYCAADVYGSKESMETGAEEFLGTWGAQKRRTAVWAAESVERHRWFLIASMLQGKEAIKWIKTPLWKYVEARFGDMVDEIRKRMKAALGKVKAKPESRSATPSSQAGVKRKREEMEGVQKKRELLDNAASHSRRSTTVESGAESEMSLSRIRRGRSRNLAGQSAPPTVLTPKGKTTPRVPVSEGESDGSKPVAAAQKGKSVLRPRQSEYVPKLSTGDDSQEQTEEPSSPVRTLDTISVAFEQPIGKHSGLSRVLHKRSARQSMHDPQQARAGAADVDEGIDMSLDGAEDESGADQSEAFESSSAITSRLRPEDLEAKGQGDTWTCPLDGCLHKVYAASDSASQMLIKEHYRLHVDDDDADMRMQLVRRMQAPGLPVNRLMGLIQTKAGQRGFPAPITQRY